MIPQHWFNIYFFHQTTLFELYLMFRKKMTNYINLIWLSIDMVNQKSPSVVAWILYILLNANSSALQVVIRVMNVMNVMLWPNTKSFPGFGVMSISHIQTSHWVISFGWKTRSTVADCIQILSLMVFSIVKMTSTVLANFFLTLKHKVSKTCEHIFFSKCKIYNLSSGTYISEKKRVENNLPRQRYHILCV